MTLASPRRWWGRSESDDLHPGDRPADTTATDWRRETIDERGVGMVTGSLQRQQALGALPSLRANSTTTSSPDQPRALTPGVPVLAGHGLPTHLHHALDAVAWEPYEGRTGYGRIILAAADHPEINMAVWFLEPIRLGAPRLVRKALEMTGDGLCLICDGEHLLGLGSLRPPAIMPAGITGDDCCENADDQSAPDESIFEIDVLGQGVWQMNHRGAPLLRVTNTRPSLPMPRLSRGDFTDIAAWLFPEAAGDDVEALWLLAANASSADHGTMLVVHRDAAAEASRLLPQAQRIAPTRLDGHILQAITSIDGAVLVDPSARCHAVGVILDGHATGTGDSGRGARFNSAVRYQQAVGADCMVVIVSEDGMIDLIPRLRPDPGQGRTQPRQDRPGARLRPWPAEPRTRQGRRQDHKQAAGPGHPAGHHHR